MNRPNRAALARLIRQLPDMDLGDRLPLTLGGRRLGWLEPAFADYLKTLACPAGRFLADGSWDLDAGLPHARLSEHLAALAARCRADGWLPAWRDELFDVTWPEGGDSLAFFERGAFRRFGLVSQAVHLNGIRHDGTLWVARRSPRKAVDPGKLDNLVGGGMGAGETPADTLGRECWEEAGIPPELIATARPIAKLHARRPEFDGIHDEWLYSFDVALPADFVPQNQDGEVAEFMIMDREELTERVLAGEFTGDAGAITADWLLRTEGCRG